MIMVMDKTFTLLVCSVKTVRQFPSCRNKQSITTESSHLQGNKTSKATCETQPQDRKGSTDMGNVCWEVPSIQPEIQIADKIPGHSRDFAEASRSDRARLAMLAAAKALAAVSLEVWANPELYRQAKDEFALGVQAGV